MSSNDALQRAKEIAARLQRKSNFSDGPSAAPEPKRQRRGGFSDAPPPGAAAAAPAGNFSSAAPSQPPTQLSAAAQMAMEAVKALRAKNAAPAQRSSSYGGGFSSAASQKPPEPEGPPRTTPKFEFSWDPCMEEHMLMVHIAMSVHEVPREAKKVFVPTDQPGVNFMGLLLGPRGATLRDMQERHQCKIIIRGQGSNREGTARSFRNEPHEDDELPLHVSIEGPYDAVAKAEKEVSSLLHDPQSRHRLKQKQLSVLQAGDGQLALTNGGADFSTDAPSWQVVAAAPRAGETTYEARVPNGMVGLVIGKGGETIKRLQYECGVRVQIASDPEPKDPNDPRAVETRRIAMTGTPEGIDRAKRDLDEMLRTRQNSNTLNPANAAVAVDVVVANDKVGLIIGRQGSTIKGIQERSGAHVKIPAQADEHNPNARTITIAADTQYAVNEARAEIEQLLANELERHAGGLADDPVFGPATPYAVPEGCVGLIIGKGGETISRLQQATGARIQIPNEAAPGTDPPMRYIMIGGLPDARTRAQYEIAALVGQHETRNPGMGSAMVDPYAQTADPYAADPYGYGAAAPAAALAPDAYYQDFWNYVGWYGEEAARATYGAYAPPPGTAPPPPPAPEPLPPGMAQAAAQPAAAQPAQPAPPAAPAAPTPTVEMG